MTDLEGLSRDALKSCAQLAEKNVEKLIAENFNLRDEIERLRAALKPFAEVDPIDESEVDLLVSKPGAVAAARSAYEQDAPKDG